MWYLFGWLQFNTGKDKGGVVVVVGGGGGGGDNYNYHGHRHRHHILQGCIKIPVTEAWQAKSLTHWILLKYYLATNAHTGCPRGNVPDHGRMLLTLKYTDITQNTYIRSWALTEIMAREVWKYDSCYTLTDYKIQIKTGRNM